MSAQVNVQECLEEGLVMFCGNRSEMFCMGRQMTTKTKKFSHRGKTYDVIVTPGRDGFSVRAFDQSGHGVGRMFSVTYETEGDFGRVTGDPAVAALMQLVQEDIKKKHLKEPKKADARIVGQLRELAFCVSYTSFGDQELELPERFDHLDDAVEAAWVLLNAGIARMVDIPDPKRKGGSGGLRHSQIVDRGKQRGYVI
jgi:hypothetical protein